MLLTSLPVPAEAFAQLRHELVQTVRFLNGKGWTPATSSNFSARVPGGAGAIAISRSGVDKALFSEEDVMLVDRQGRTLWPDGAKSSAETLIHTAVYELYNPGAVLHTHSVGATAFSLRHAKERVATFAGLELLKGLSGIGTHDVSIDVPIFPNDQDMPRFSASIAGELGGRSVFGFLIEGHGLYTWGATLADARRHVEVFEYLFELSRWMA